AGESTVVLVMKFHAPQSLTPGVRGRAAGCPIAQWRASVALGGASGARCRTARCTAGGRICREWCCGHERACGCGHGGSSIHGAVALEACERLHLCAVADLGVAADAGAIADDRVAAD